jgi:hypothetical protein
MRFILMHMALIFAASQNAKAEGLNAPIMAETVAPHDPSHGERLSAAVHMYQRGEGPTAATMLAALINDTTLVDASTRRDAQVYLGEVHYSQGNKEEARRLFESVLTSAPLYTIDPFAHPPDVVGFFETIRTYLRPATPITPTLPPVALGPVPKTPPSAFIGFGIYQIQNGDKRMGTALAIGQSICAIVSVASFGGLLDNREWSSTTELTRLRTQKTVQWTSTAGFYSLWIWSAMDAKRHWRAHVNISRPQNSDRAQTPSKPKFQLALSIPIR